MASLFQRFGPREAEPTLPPELRAAAADYRLLLERGYPQRALLKLVGDRYRLSAEHRTILARGMCTAREAAARRRKLTRSVHGVPVRVDCLNVLLTIRSYLHGRRLFIGVDGFLRDAAEVHGGSVGAGELDRPIELLLDFAAQGGAAELVFYVDAPVSHSGRTAASVREALGRRGLAGSALVTPSPDRLLKEARDCVIATSDSAVIDAARVRVADIARLALESSFRPSFLRLDRLRKGQAGRRERPTVYSQQ